jgi:PAS domain S-box-containing protein
MAASVPGKPRGGRRGVSLGTRLAVATTLVLVVASGLLYFQLTSHERERLVASKITGATMVARLVAADTAAAIDLGDSDDLTTELDKLRTNPDVLAAALWQAGAEVPVAEWRVPGAPSFTPPGDDDGSSSVASRQWIETSEPVMSPRGARLGSIKLRVSLDRETLAYAEARRTYFWTSLGLAAGTALLLVLIARHQIVRPLSRLRVAVKRFEQGDRDARCDVRSRDEIGDLAGAFNAMGEAVASRQRQVEAAEARFRALIETMPDAVVLSQAGTITYANPAFVSMVGCEPPGLVGRALASILPRRQEAGATETAEPASVHREERWNVRGRTILVDRRERAVSVEGVDSSLLIARDVTDHRRLQAQLLQSDKLAAIGTLAAGVAHEINTPVQFVNDSVCFVRAAWDDLASLFDRYRVLHEAARTCEPLAELVAGVDAAEEEADLAYLRVNMPSALELSADGLGRIAAIVRSLKVFAHPDSNEMQAVDLNKAVEATLTVARYEYKYVAELETSFGELPPVTCHAGDVNQAVLNIVVNAAHAIAGKGDTAQAKGRITVTTRREGDTAVISVTDTGPGIPAEIRDRIFDPFFTTKGVGKGTGQGLSIARALVAERHGGQITFETEVGKGTTFHIRLPIASQRHAGSSERVGVAA